MRNGFAFFVAAVPVTILLWGLLVISVQAYLY